MSHLTKVHEYSGNRQYMRYNDINKRKNENITCT